MWITITYKQGFLQGVVNERRIPINSRHQSLLSRNQMMVLRSDQRSAVERRRVRRRLSKTVLMGMSLVATTRIHQDQRSLIRSPRLRYQMMRSVIGQTPHHALTVIHVLACRFTFIKNDSSRLITHQEATTKEAEEREYSGNPWRPQKDNKSSSQQGIGSSSFANRSRWSIHQYPVDINLSYAEVLQNESNLSFL